MQPQIPAQKEQTKTNPVREKVQLAQRPKKRRSTTPPPPPSFGFCFEYQKEKKDAGLQSKYGKMVNGFVPPM